MDSAHVDVTLWSDTYDGVAGKGKRLRTSKRDAIVCPTLQIAIGRKFNLTTWVARETQHIKGQILQCDDDQSHGHVLSRDQNRGIRNAVEEHQAGASVHSETPHPWRNRPARGGVL